MTSKFPSSSSPDASVPVDAPDAASAKRKAYKGKGLVDEPLKKTRVLENRKDFLRSQLGINLTPFAHPSYVHSERPATLEEIVASEGPSIGGVSSFSESVLEVAPLGTLFILSDDSDPEEAVREAAAVKPGTFVRETMAAQPMDIPIPEYFQPPRESGLGQSFGAPTSSAEGSVNPWGPSGRGCP